MYQITFKQIHSFLVIGKTLNFTTAAKLLYISQPALSKQMFVLENEIGFPLLKRNKRTVSLTIEGESLYRDWTLMESMMTTSIDNAKLLKEKTVGHLTIGCTDTFSIDEQLSKLIYNYREYYPNVDIDLGSYGFRVLKEQFDNGDLDIIFIPEFEIKNYKNVHALRFQNVALCIAVPASFPLSRKKHVTVEDLKNQPMITISPSESSLGVNKIKAYCKSYGFEPNIIKYSSNLNSVLLGVKNGIGITICDSKVKDPKIKTFILENQPHDSDMMVLWKKDLKHPELDLFIHLLKDMIPQN